jgi:hypothetical protein
MRHTPEHFPSTLSIPVNADNVTFCLGFVHEAVLEVLGTIFSFIQIGGYVEPVGRRIEFTVAMGGVYRVYYRSSQILEDNNP